MLAVTPQPAQRPLPAGVNAPLSLSPVYAYVRNSPQHWSTGTLHGPVAHDHTAHVPLTRGRCTRHT